MALVYILLLVLILIAIRVLGLLYLLHSSRDDSFSFHEINKSTTKTMVIMGSGGHTTEMIRLVEPLGSMYSPRVYVVAKNDDMSVKKIEALGEKNNQNIVYSIVKIPRSREVHQSYLTSIGTTLYSFLHCINVMWQWQPQLVLCNGPGTCIPICAVAFLLKCFLLMDIKIIFIESICRVKTMSLSGKILYVFADYLLVQWPDLVHSYPRTKFLSRLV